MGCRPCLHAGKIIYEDPREQSYHPFAEFFTRSSISRPCLKCNGHFGGHHHALAGAWVAGFPRSSFFDLEDTDIVEFDAAFRYERIEDPVEDPLDTFQERNLG